MPMFSRILLRFRWGSVISWALMKISPELASSSLFRHRRNVLLPDPEGPMTAQTSPLATVVLMPRRT